MKSSEILKQINALKSEDPDERVGAIQFLGTVTGTGSMLHVFPLIVPALNDDSDRVAYFASGIVSRIHETLHGREEYTVLLNVSLPSVLLAARKWSANQEIMIGLSPLLEVLRGELDDLLALQASLIKDTDGEQNTGWSDSLKEQTRKIIENVDLASFLLNGQCHLKNSNPDHRFGYITVNDAIARRYVVQLKGDEGAEVFDSLDELIDAGWAVD